MAKRLLASEKRKKKKGFERERERRGQPLLIHNQRDPRNTGGPIPADSCLLFQAAWDSRRSRFSLPSASRTWREKKPHAFYNTFCEHQYRPSPSVCSWELESNVPLISVLAQGCNQDSDRAASPSPARKLPEILRKQPACRCHSVLWPIWG